MKLVVLGTLASLASVSVGHAGPRDEGKTCINGCPGDATPPSGDDGDSDDDVGTVEPPAPSHPEWETWQPPQHDRRTVTERRRPEQVQSIVHLYRGGRVPIVDRGHPPPPDRTTIASGSLPQVATVRLPPAAPVHYPTFTRDRPLALAIRAGSHLEPNALAKQQAGKLAAHFGDLSGLTGAAMTADPSAATQRLTEDLFGVDKLRDFNAALVSAPRKLEDSFEDMWRELQDVWAKAVK